MIRLNHVGIIKFEREVKPSPMGWGRQFRHQLLVDAVTLS